VPFCPPDAGEAPPVALRAASASAPSAPRVTLPVPVPTAPPASRVHTAFPAAHLAPGGFVSCPCTGVVAAPSGVFDGLQTFSSGSGNVHAAAGGAASPDTVSARMLPN
ncbi:hypothetical protein VM98_37650, partial [Streptomyces rubellomurinus subsp. indigoferus]